MKNKKTEESETLFFKASARFLLTSKCCSWFNKVVYDWLSIKWTSWKDNDMLIKVEFVKKTPLELVIGQQMSKEGHDQSY